MLRRYHSSTYLIYLDQSSIGDTPMTSSSLILRQMAPSPELPDEQRSFLSSLIQVKYKFGPYSTPWGQGGGQ